jgi:hypothetical protein
MQRSDPLGPGRFEPEEFIYAGFHVTCPRCAGHVVARTVFNREIHPHMTHLDMHLACPHCAYSRKQSQNYSRNILGVSFRWREQSAKLPRERKMLRKQMAWKGAPSGDVLAKAWAVTQCRGAEVIAINPWHLEAMRGYIAPALRRDCRWPSLARMDWRARMPRWMKLASNRGAMLRALDRLEARLCEGL